MKRGFTLIELVFVIVIIGILSAVLVPRFDRPTLTQAANQIISHIRYTQHLAMVDNKFDSSDPNWYKKRWQLDFRDPTGRAYYTIYQDLNHNGSPSTVVSKNEIAKNPLNPKQLLTALSTDEAINSKEMNLYKKYGIDSITFSDTCCYYDSQRVSFDYLGRPLYGDPQSLSTMYNNNPNYSKAKIRLVQSRCTITLTDIDGNSKQIAIEPETGYTHIL